MRSKYLSTSNPFLCRNFSIILNNRRTYPMTKKNLFNDDALQRPSRASFWNSTLADGREMTEKCHGTVIEIRLRYEPVPKLATRIYAMTAQRQCGLWRRVF